MYSFDEVQDEIDNFNDYELVDSFCNMLTDAATGGSFDNDIYKYMRNKIVHNKHFQKHLPQWVKTNRDIGQFWNFIKHKFGTYAERREFLKDEFTALLDYLEFDSQSPMDEHIVFDESHIHEQWQKALERKQSDPEGAITISRTLIESVLKHILDKEGIEYGNNKELSELYKEVSKLLNFAPENHQEQIFKQILGNANGVISGLGALRNKLGDSHGTGTRRVKPQERHSELAVNLAGTMAVFIYKTYQQRSINE